MPHSALFNRCTNKGNGLEHSPCTLIIKEVIDYATYTGKDLGSVEKHASLTNFQNIYSDLADLFRETNDAQFGIVSSLDSDKNVWRRDATNALPLDEQIPQDSSILEANNALMRCLSRLRPIDYVLEKKYSDHSLAWRKELNTSFTTSCAAILAVAQDKKLTEEEKKAQIDQLEEDFNTSLIQVLHAANLTKGCYTKKDAEKLLFYYRNLSSLLNPARTLVTETFDPDTNVFHRETSYPVTEKTPQQKEAMKPLQKIQPHPFESEKNAHNVNPVAMQEADSFFYDLMIMDDRALPAQTRKTHLVGAKNAFLVKMELIDEPVFVNGKLVEKNGRTLWFARSGVPVYVGPGEDENSLIFHSQENLEQMLIAARKQGLDKQKIQVLSLITDSHIQDQSKMIDILYKVTRDNSENEHDISYVPTNLEGTFSAMDVSPKLGFELVSSSLPFQKTDRVTNAVQVAFKAATLDDEEHTLLLIQCASGQDRTGTVAELLTQLWDRVQYGEMGKAHSNIEAMRAQAAHNAEIAGHLVGSSFGMKSESKANNFFGKQAALSPEASSALYRISASTNKINKVGKVDLKSCSDESKYCFDQKLKQFKNQLHEFIKEAGLSLQNPEEIKFLQNCSNLAKDIERVAEEHPDAETIHNLEILLTHCINIAKNRDTQENIEDDLMRVVSFAQYSSEKPSNAWKVLGIALLTFACLALITAGVLLAIPSGGTSLLMTVAGFTGLSLGASAAVGGAAIAIPLVAGAVSMHQGLAKKEFSRSLHDIISFFKIEPKDDKQDKSDEREIQSPKN